MEPLANVSVPQNPPDTTDPNSKTQALFTVQRHSHRGKKMNGATLFLRGVRFSGNDMAIIPSLHIPIR
ncbi:MAG: hypothetical protein ABW189_07165 [Rickettsiales bacterium]